MFLGVEGTNAIWRLVGEGTNLNNHANLISLDPSIHALWDLHTISFQAFSASPTPIDYLKPVEPYELQIVLNLTQSKAQPPTLEGTITTTKGVKEGEHAKFVKSGMSFSISSSMTQFPVPHPALFNI